MKGHKRRQKEEAEEFCSHKCASDSRFMATAAKASSVWINFQKNHGEICSSCRSYKESNFFRFISLHRTRRLVNHGLRGMVIRKEMRRSSVVKLGCAYNTSGEMKINGCCCGVKGYDISEEDLRFVEVLREVQSYVCLHRGNTFVLLLSGEIIASPYLDTILKVPPPQSFSLLLLLKLEN
ncbi:hypothetical protein REPUB_Repub09cG0151100 [Reevesia pubescens]